LGAMGELQAKVIYLSLRQCQKVDQQLFCTPLSRTLMYHDGDETLLEISANSYSEFYCLYQLQVVHSVLSAVR
jgi:hypothetical protein